MTPAIWWIRRDLRLADNPALAAACQAGEVIPVFILDPVLLSSANAGPQRVAFLLEGLHRLKADLIVHGSNLIVRQGDPLEVLQTLLAETQSGSIFAEADVSPFARRRDERVQRQLPLHRVHGLTVYPPEMLHKEDGRPYTVFTPFSRMWRNLPFPGSPLPSPGQLPRPPSLASVEIPALPQYSLESHFPPGEAEAQRRLAEFTRSTIQRYALERDRLDLEGTSALSPYLRFGMLSARQAAWAALQISEQAENSSEQRGAET